MIQSRRWVGNWRWASGLRGAPGHVFTDIATLEIQHRVELLHLKGDGERAAFGQWREEASQGRVHTGTGGLT